ncbi:RES family NAD+ phosphorylase [Mucilaginibacter pedocola]|uniref:RES domain-containing protein n=1 Tax=Mucilaginibacter pedocola TaxID=1792845 RepID=A0A1S9PJC3_9SPHI|nr:RES family NAD+ phosphorylase [Mucilaginibacter pedocola]OOQ61037.1 hypothetical protein BC343_21545 [Mucilaginibacter pedocola]
MILYRIARDKYAYDLSGKGGLLSAARWHDHMPVLYTSLSSSTSILEKLVHMQTGEIHNDLVMTGILVPDDASAQQVTIPQLPLNWQDYPAPLRLQRIGNAWLRQKSALLLYIPSVIDPLAKNVLINPMHPEAAALKIAEAHPFRFDRRLFAANN